jgi:ribosomal protein S18 acetylase RimI-like enzyme
LKEAPMTSPPALRIRPYEAADEAAVVELWHECGLTRPWNDPRRDIARKLTVQPELFLIGTTGAGPIATAMVGFDGHRGWVNYLAVAPGRRHRAIGRVLMQEAERLLTALGCPKLNLQVRSSNTEVLAFYRALGYVQDDVASLGRRLIVDDRDAT